MNLQLRRILNRQAEALMPVVTVENAEMPPRRAVNTPPRLIETVTEVHGRVCRLAPLATSTQIFELMCELHCALVLVESTEKRLVAEGRRTLGQMRTRRTA